MTPLEKAVCPACASEDLQAADAFVVRQKGNGILPDSFKMLSCSLCGLWFKHPRPDSETLKHYYNSLSLQDDNWDYRERLPHQKQIDQLLRQLPAGAKVLDVGCWTGGLLADHPRLDRYGIEPNESAAAVARTKGISIIAERVVDKGQPDEIYDVITMVDVFEHLDNPTVVLNLLFKQIKKGGRLIVVTGRTNSWPVKIAASTYWYFSVIPDHLVFLNRSFVNWTARSLNAASVELKPMCHYPFSLRNFVWERSWLLTWRYLNPNSPFNYALSRTALSNVFRNWIDIPICRSFKDHYYVTFYK